MVKILHIGDHRVHTPAAKRVYLTAEQVKLAHHLHAHGGRSLLRFGIISGRIIKDENATI